MIPRLLDRGCIQDINDIMRAEKAFEAPRLLKLVLSAFLVKSCQAPLYHCFRNMTKRLPSFLSLGLLHANMRALLRTSDDCHYVPIPNGTRP